MTQRIVGRDLTMGDRVVAFTPDADAIVTDTVEMEHGGLILSLDIYARDGAECEGQTFFIVNPEAAYDVLR